MLSSAWMAGADTAPAHHAPAVVVHAPGHGTCGGCATACDPCCDSGRGGLFSRLRGWFSKKNDCCEPECKPAKVECCKPAKVECCPAPAKTCGGCDSCCDSGRGGLFSRLRGRWKKNDCCDPCADACHGTVVPAHPVKPEQLKDAPKKMPEKVSAPTIELVPTVNPKPIIGAGGPGNPF
jgi:hypothetical protein